MISHQFFEFFQDQDGHLSMSRMLMFGSFFVASAVMIWLSYTGKMNEGYFSMYLAAYSGTYLIGKSIDAHATKKGA